MIYPEIYSQTLADFFVSAEIMRLWIERAEINFLHRAPKLSEMGQVAQRDPDGDAGALH